MPMRRTVGRAGLLLALAFAGGPAVFAAPGDPAIGRDFVVDRVVALVNAQVITQHEFEQALRPHILARGGIVDPEIRRRLYRDLRDQVIEQLVANILVLDEARKLELKVTPAEIDEYIGNLKQQNHWDDRELQRQVRGLGFENLAAYRTFTEGQILRAQVIQFKVWSRIKVGDGDVQREFLARYHGGESKDEVRASHIFFVVGPGDSRAALLAKQDRALDVRRQIAAGELSFEEAAQKYSEDAGTADRGGDVGFFARGTLEETFTDVAFGLATGELSPVVRTELGYHIIRVNERRSTPIRPEEKEEILSRLREDLTLRERERTYVAWVKQLRERAFVQLRVPDEAPVTLDFTPAVAAAEEPAAEAEPAAPPASAPPTSPSADAPAAPADADAPAAPQLDDLP